MSRAPDEAAVPVAPEGCEDAPIRRPCRTSFAQVDPGLLRSTLFRPLPRRGRSTAQTVPLKAVTAYSGVQLTVTSPYQLGAEDLSVLLALCALANLDGQDVQNNDRGVLKERFQWTKEISLAPHVGFQTTLFGLVRETGLADSGKANDRIRKALERLGSVVYLEKGDGRRRLRGRQEGGSERLLWSDVEQKNGKVQIILGARLSNAMRGGYFTWINLDLTRRLNEPDLLLHVLLLERVWTSEERSTRLDTLATQLFGSPPTSEAALPGRQRSSRLQYVRRSLKSLGGLAKPEKRHVWKIVLQRDVAKISRLEQAVRTDDNIARQKKKGGSPTN